MKIAQNEKKPPFNEVLPEALFYGESQREQCVNFLLHLAPYSNDVLVVHGDRGSGKTTLIKQFASKASDNWRLCMAFSSEIPDISSLVKLLEIRYGIRPLDDMEREEQLQVLAEELHALQSRGQRPIVVVDDAQALKEDVIDFMLALLDTLRQHGEGASFVFCAEDEFLKRPAFERIKAFGVHTFEVAPLTREEVQHYVASHLKHVGMPATMFSDMDIELLHTQSSGNVGVINILARDKLNYGGGEITSTGHRPRKSLRDAMEASDIKVPASRYLVAGIMLLVFVGVMVAQFVPFEAPKISQSPPPSETPAEKTVVAAAGPAVLGGESAASDSDSLTARPSELAGFDVADVDYALAPPSQPDGLPVFADDSAVSPDSSLLSQEASAVFADMVSEAVTADASAPAPVVVAAVERPGELASVASSPEAAPTPPPAAGVTSATGEVPGSEVASSETGAVGAETIPVAPEPSAIEPAEPATTVAAAPATKPAESTPVTAAEPVPPAPVEAPSPVPPVAVAPTPTSGGGINRDAWLLAQDPQAFTLQLAAVSKESGIIAALKPVNDLSAFAYFRMLRGGKTLYGLVYGIYPDEASARAAATSLPKQFAKVTPLVKKLEVIQTDIRKAEAGG